MLDPAVTVEPLAGAPMTTLLCAKAADANMMEAATRDLKLKNIFKECKTGCWVAISGESRLSFYTIFGKII
jgi:hypothetical protein